MSHFGLQKKIVGSILCITIVATSFSPLTAPKAEASFLDSLGGGLFSTLLGCTGLADKAIGGIGKLFGKLGNGSSGGEDSADTEKVPTKDSKVGTETASINKKETCLDAIAYNLAKVALKSLTESTLNWINSGFAGEPTYVKDPKSFFGSIADEELGSFTAGIAFDPDVPFGRRIAQKIIGTISGQLEINAQASRNDLLNDNPNYIDLSYEQKFKVIQDDLTALGGWDNYLKVQDISWANPADAEIRAINNAGGKVNAALQYQNPVKQVEEDLAQSGGFLSLKKCVSPVDYQSPESDTSFTFAQATAQAQNDPGDSDTAAAQDWLRVHTCKQWATQTPGQAISQQLNINLGTSVRQLELADSLNESLAAVFDALVKQLFNKGVASLSGEDSSGGGSSVAQFGGYGTNNGSTTLVAGTAGSSQNGDQWYNQNKNFDLITAIAPISQQFPNGQMDPDPSCQVNSISPSLYAELPTCIKSGFLAQGIITLTKEYIALLKEQNRELSRALSWISELDMCVPGPRSDWYNDALAVVQNAQQEIEERLSLIDVDQTAAAVQSTLDPGGFFDWFEQDKAKVEKRKTAANIVKSITGVEASTEADGAPGPDIDDGEYAIDFAFAANARKALMQALQKTDGEHEGYREKIDRLYRNNNDLLNLNVLNKQAYAKKRGFQNAMQDNTEEIALLTAYLPRLKSIYDDVLAAQARYNINTNLAGHPTAAETEAYRRYYDNELRVFSSMVSNLKDDKAVDSALADIETAKGETAFIGDPQSGLVRICIDEISTLSPDLVRRPYGEPLPSPAEYVALKWPILAPTYLSGGLPLFRSPANIHQTFLLRGGMTAWKWQYDAHPSELIYLGSFMKQCFSDSNDNMYVQDFSGASLYSPVGNYFNIGNCSGPQYATGDLFENAINSY